MDFRVENLEVESEVSHAIADFHDDAVPPCGEGELRVVGPRLCPLLPSVRENALVFHKEFETVIRSDGGRNLAIVRAVEIGLRIGDGVVRQ